MQGHALRVFSITVPNLIGQILKACMGNMTTSVKRHVKVRWISSLFKVRDYSVMHGPFVLLTYVSILVGSNKGRRNQ